jgi:hypothetical protein
MTLLVMAVIIVLGVLYSLVSRPARRIPVAVVAESGDAIPTTGVV